MGSATIHREFQMAFHNNVNKKMTLVNSNDIMLYARGKTYTIKHWLKGAPEIWAGLHDQRRNGVSIINSLRISLQSKRLARSFEFTRHSSIAGSG